MNEGGGKKKLGGARVASSQHGQTLYLVFCLVLSVVLSSSLVFMLCTDNSQ